MLSSTRKSTWEARRTTRKKRIIRQKRAGTKKRGMSRESGNGFIPPRPGYGARNREGRRKAGQN